MNTYQRFETSDNREPIPEQRAELNRFIRALPRKRKLKFCRKFCRGRQAVRRDFVVFDTADHPNFDGSTVIMHLPSMIWRGFDFSFETALKSLDDPRCEDKELIEAIYGIERRS
jgi:hypothetical protein